MIINDIMDFKRWSEWRKWDLHVHAPTEYTLIKKDDYKWTSREWKMENFIDELKWLSDIAVLWVADYFSIEWYKEVKKYKDSLSNIKLIIPNLELRITPETRDWKKINLHVLFNTENLSDDKIEQFLYSFIFPQQGRNFTCKKTDLIELWRTFEKKESDEEALKRWLNEFCITYQNFFEKLDEQDDFFRNNILIWVSNNSEDGVSWIKDLPWIRNIIYRWVDFIFSSQESDRMYFLWKWVDDEKTIIEKYGSLKPCIHGSDYHWSTWGRVICVPDLNRFCWIKANPTFEWLKQILYEPEDRVKIQEALPEDKESYLLIDKVKFIDNDFTPNEILLSKNLTTIIWWKSTWKSILLRAIAETIDKKEVEQRLKDISMPINTKIINKFSVMWWDWQESNENLEKKIIYIPQSYLNRITEDWKSENAIIDIIVNILKNDLNISLAFEKLDQQKRVISQTLNKNIEDLFFIIDEWKKCNEKMKNIWDKKWIENEINSLEKDIDILKKSINLTSEELELYNQLTKDIDENRRSLIMTKKAIEIYKKLQWLDSYFWLNPQVESYISECPKDYKDILIHEFEVQEEYYVDNLKNKLLEFCEEKEKYCIELSKSITNLEKQIQPLNDKIKKSQLLKEKINRLKVEKKKLADIIIEETLRESILSKYKNIVTELAKNISSYYFILMSIKNDILEQKVITEQHGLVFDIEVKFDFLRLNENFLTRVFDQRKNLPEECQFSENMDIDQFEKTVKSIISKTLSKDKDLPIRNGFTEKEVITKLSQSWYFFNYKIEEDGDELDQMSPWKKSYVLLKLLIELDNSKCPILLDQPEDDLDNRSIYQDLARFIKEKKKSRQFIIATHNPNLVVGTDAECIIVANQEWNKSKNKNYRFEYVEWSLEDTKELDLHEECILYRQWIQEHICEILEWWKEAFEQRKNKYSFINN